MGRWKLYASNSGNQQRCQEVEQSWCSVKDTIRDVIKEEGALFRESLPVRGLLNPLGSVERGDIEVNLGSIKDYLESIVQGNGWPSDLDIWECVWDVAESIHLLAPCVARKNEESIGRAGHCPCRSVWAGSCCLLFTNTWSPLGVSRYEISRFVALIRVPDLYIRYPKYQGTRRFGWRFQVPTLLQRHPQSSSARSNQSV